MGSEEIDGIFDQLTSLASKTRVQDINHCRIVAGIIDQMR
jgi:hypothetical protein